MPVPLPVCHQCESCGCSLHNGTGHHSLASLTGSTRQPSWRVRPGSVDTSVSKDFTDDTVADVRVFSANTRARVIRARDTTLYRAGRRRCVSNNTVTFLYRLFYPFCAGSLSGHLLSPVPAVQRADFPDNPAHRHTPATAFLVRAVYFTGKVCR